MHCITQTAVHTEEDYKSFDCEEGSKQIKSIIVPRPIAFITSQNAEGIVNAAPFSYFNAVCENPPILSVSIGSRDGKIKDTSCNIHATKEFVVNICSIDLAEEVTIASKDYPPDISEIQIADLALIPSEKISVPRIANTLAQMECILYQAIKIGHGPTDLILGRIVKIHLHKDIIDDREYVDIKKLNPLARLAVSYGQTSQL